MRIIHYSEKGFEDVHCIAFKSEPDLLDFMITLTNLYSNKTGFPGFLLTFDEKRLTVPKEKAMLERARDHFVSLRDQVQRKESHGKATKEKKVVQSDNIDSNGSAKDGGKSQRGKGRG